MHAACACACMCATGSLLYALSVVIQRFDPAWHAVKLVPCMQAFNLLPVGCLDGGRMMLSAFGRNPLNVTSILTYLGLALSVIGGPMSLPFGLFVIFAQRDPEFYVQDQVQARTICWSCDQKCACLSMLCSRLHCRVCQITLALTIVSTRGTFCAACCKVEQCAGLNPHQRRPAASGHFQHLMQAFAWEHSTYLLSSTPKRHARLCRSQRLATRAKSSQRCWCSRPLRF